MWGYNFKICKPNIFDRKTRLFYCFVVSNKKADSSLASFISVRRLPLIYIYIYKLYKNRKSYLKYICPPIVLRSI